MTLPTYKRGRIQGLTPLLVPIAGSYEQLDVDTVQQLTAPAEALIAVVAAENTSMRYLDDSTAPTTSRGMPIPAGSYVVLENPGSHIQIIGVTSGGTAHVSYYR